MRPRRAAALATVLALATVAPVPAGELVWSGSLGWATGDYTLTETTRTFVLINEMAWVGESASLAFTVPVVDRSSPYVTLVGGVQPVPTGRRFGAPADPGMTATPAAAGMGPGAGNRRRDGPIEVPDPETIDYASTGMADPSLRFDLELARSAGGDLGLYAAAKIPVADEDEGLSTGEWDFGAGLTFAFELGRGELLGELGWWRFGDLPDFEIDDSAVGYLAFGWPLAGDWSWRVFAAGWSQGFDGADPPAEAGLVLRRRLGGGSRLSLTAAAGLTDTASDLRLSLGWSLPL